jgi:hypothetical protein
MLCNIYLNLSDRVLSLPRLIRSRILVINRCEHSSKYVSPSLIFILFAMPGDQYCEPCRRLLCGKAQPCSEEDEPSWSFRFYLTHHPDTNSFNESLQLPCSICSLAWNQTECSVWQESMSHGIVACLNVLESDDDARKLRFVYDLMHYSCDLSLVSWKTMFSE